MPAAAARYRQLELTPATKGRAFFTERSLAEYLAVSDRTIRTWIRRGELASYKLGGSRRIDPRDVDSFLAARRENGTSR
jgi:excisionase family DNA binding protein